MHDSYGQHGWREFLSNRSRILAEYDRLKVLIVNRPVQVAHGVGLEAAVREWFTEFLPRRYGVTSGYVVPDLYDDTLPLYHFDIVIYDALSAPVLWTEGNADQSAQGKARAIPAKHVVGIYEVKSRLTSKDVRECIEKLSQTSTFASQMHPHYSCGAIFAELQDNDNKGSAILKRLLGGTGVFGFVGGMVLRYEGDSTSTGLIGFHRREVEGNLSADKASDPMRGLPLARPIDALAIYLREDGQLELGEQGAGAELACVETGRWEVSKFYGRSYFEGALGVSLSWSRGNFSRFCIELIGRLEGLTRTDDKMPSFGRVFDHVATRRAPLQAAGPIEGKPFLVASLHPGGPAGQTISISQSRDQATLSYWICLENRGGVAAEISDDGFKTKSILAAGAKAIKPVSLVVTAKEVAKGIGTALAEKPVEVRHRVVYRIAEGSGDLLAIDSRIVLDEKNPQLIALSE